MTFYKASFPEIAHQDMGGNLIFLEVVKAWHYNNLQPQNHVTAHPMKDWSPLATRGKCKIMIMIIWARFMSLAHSKLRLCSVNHRAGYFSNLACDWLSIVRAYSKQETGNGPRIRIRMIMNIMMMIIMINIPYLILMGELWSILCWVSCTQTILGILSCLLW